MLSGFHPIGKPMGFRHKFITDIDILETIFDCECAALTKPDKPRNAYKTFQDFYPEFYNTAKPYRIQL